MNNSRFGLADISTRWLVTATAFILLTVSSLSPAADENAGDIVVTNVRGDVATLVRGETRTPRVGNNIELPASIRTGADGMLDLQQGRTTLSVSANSTLEVPATNTQGAALDRIVQTRGSALYRVGKRTGQKLRVETPYLVAVVKGTQFNVVVQPDSATIALFEGALEIWSADGNDVVQLNAGEIAVRRGGEPRIRVLRMDTGETLRAAVAPQMPVISADPGSATDASSVTAGNTTLATNARIGGSMPSVGVSTQANASSNSSGATNANDHVGIAAASNTDVSAGVGIGNSTTGVNAGLTGNVNLGSVSNVGVGASTNLGAVTANLGVDVGLNLGTGSVTANTGISVGGVNAGASVNASGGGVVADVNLGGINLGVNVGLPGTGGGAISTPAATVTTPAVSLPAVTVPVVSVPAVTTPIVSTPIITTPIVTTPIVTTPVVTTPVITTPAVTTPVVTITVPAVTTPVVTTPAVTIPVTVPVVTTPVPTTPGGVLGSLTGHLGLP